MRNDDLPDYFLIAELTTALALNTVDPTAPIPLTPEDDGMIVSIEASAWDPTCANITAATGGVQATNQAWGATEKFLGAEWKIDSTSKTMEKYMPLIHIGGTAQRPKYVRIPIAKNQIIKVSFKNLLTGAATPSLVGRIVFNMKRS